MRIKSTDARFYNEDGAPKHWSAKADAIWRSTPEPKAEESDRIVMRDDRVVVTIDGPIYDIFESDKRVASVLNRISEHQAIVVDINSVGGMVTEGSAIRSRLMRHKGDVLVQVLGIAASAAQFVTTAADEVWIAEGAQLMIHRAQMGGIIYGDWEEWAEQGRYGSELLKKVNDNIVAALSKKMSLEPEAVERLLKKETWYNDSEAVEAGLADKVYPALESEPETAAKAMVAPRMDLTADVDLPTVAELAESLRASL